MVKLGLELIIDNLKKIGYSINCTHYKNGAPEAIRKSNSNRINTTLIGNIFNNLIFFATLQGDKERHLCHQLSP